jgi:hypothetical protein
LLESTSIFKEYDIGFFKIVIRGNTIMNDGLRIERTTLTDTTPSIFLSSYKRLMLGTALLLAVGPSAYAQCSPASGAVSCSGANTSTQTITVGQPTTITTIPGFSVDSCAGTNGIDILGQGAGPIIFNDQNGSSISGGVDGISVLNPDASISNTGVGTLSLTTTGKVTGETWNGMYVYHEGRLAGDLTINDRGCHWRHKRNLR